MVRARRRSAFTLLEVTLVMVIMVLIAAASYPTLSSMYGDVKVKAAADQVRGAWAEARAKSIEENRPYRFAVQPGTGTFRVAPDDAFTDGPTSGADGASTLVIEDQLSGSIVFDIAGELASDGTWSTVTIFNPDGTCDKDIEIQLKDDDGPAVTIKVRSMTGAVSVVSARGGS